MKWREMGYNQKHLTTAERLRYEHEPDVFEIKGEEIYELDESDLLLFTGNGCVLRADGEDTP